MHLRLSFRTIRNRKAMSSVGSSNDAGMTVCLNPYPWARGVPFHQPFYTFSDKDKKWHNIKPTSKESTISTSARTSFTVLSWNIDFKRILHNQRMRAALKHLHTQVADEAINSEGSPKAPVKDKVIMLNEMTKSDLQIIQSQAWIREGFQITDLSGKFWESKHNGKLNMFCEPTIRQM